jgi:F0F1-type ATP synthase membrane subunit c/vacuolar-type H+-ATPase subunit K
MKQYITNIAYLFTLAGVILLMGVIVYGAGKTFAGRVTGNAVYGQPAAATQGFLALIIFVVLASGLVLFWERKKKLRK